MKKFKNYFNIRNTEEKLVTYLASKQTEMYDRLMKVCNRYIKEVVKQFKVKYSDVSKEAIRLPRNYYLEKDSSRFLKSVQIIEF